MANIVHMSTGKASANKSTLLENGIERECGIMICNAEGDTGNILGSVDIVPILWWRQTVKHQNPVNLKSRRIHRTQFTVLINTLVSYIQRRQFPPFVNVQKEKKKKRRKTHERC